VLSLLQLYGDASVLTRARDQLAAWPAVQAALNDLSQVVKALGDVSISLDLADLRGYAYYSGVRFAVYVPGSSDALLRGGRYDEVGAVFGRKRPAVGFSLDLKELVSLLPALPMRAAVRAPWSDAPGLREAIAALRAQGDIVVGTLPGHDSEIDEFACDRELTLVAGQWVVKTL
jgi:ATP phosphoribosyltransferase regulatory subunit